MKKIASLIIALGLIITNLLSVTAFASEGTTPSGLPLSQIESEIDNIVNQYLGVNVPGVAVGVVSNGEIIFAKNYGYADIENAVPVSDDTVFEYASTSKLFTYVAVMQLVEQGLLDLNADIRNYLPSELSEHISGLMRYEKPITMRHILNHSAGFGEYIFDFIHADPSSPPPSLLEALLGQRPRQIFEPGTASSYSNFMIGLAGYIVEYISGQPFYAYQKKNIFDRIGTENSAGNVDLSDNLSVLSTKAQGYTSDGRGGFVNSGWMVPTLYPAGNINGTLEDLARFAIALMPQPGQNSPLFENPQTLSQMLSPSYSGDGTMRGTHHGFMKLYDGQFISLGHGGDAISFSVDFAIVPEARFGIIMLANGRADYNIRGGIHDLLIANRGSVVSGSDLLPDSGEVSGIYVPLRRSDGILIDFLNYLQPVRVEAIAENKISVHSSGTQQILVQTAPYVYEYSGEATHPMMAVIMNTIHFQLEDGAVSGLMIGNGFDLVPLPSNRTVPILIGSATVAIINVLFFLVAPIVLIIQAIKRKRKGQPIGSRFNRYHSLLILCGTALVINNIAAILPVFIDVFTLSFSQFIPHIVMNYVFLLAAGAFTFLSVFGAGNESVSIKRKIAFGATTGLLVLFCVVLNSWNFFTLFA